jgi:hypothetical protein
MGIYSKKTASQKASEEDIGKAIQKNRYRGYRGIQ